MNKFIRTATVLAALAVASIAHASSTYDYSYTFASGDVMTGSFSGVASGNLVTDLSNITASFDGTPLTGSPGMFNASYDLSTFTWTADAGVASFDGTQNNFLFIDTHYPQVSNYTNFFYSITVVSTEVLSGGDLVGDSGVRAGAWTLTAAAVPETGTCTLLLAGLALVGLARRRQAARQ